MQKRKMDLFSRPCGADRGARCALFLWGDGENGIDGGRHAADNTHYEVTQASLLWACCGRKDSSQGGGS